MSATDLKSHMSQRAPNGVAPVDYGTLNLVYGTVLAGIAVAARRSPEPVRGAELVPLGAATFALSKVIAKEKVGTWMREPFVEEQADGRPPRGAGIRAAVGELVTCTRCVGAWGALGIVGLRLASPPAGRAVAAVLATSAANDFLQAGFNWATHKADEAEERVSS
jgi:hypothetical protein